jgi:hypothetical protein
VRPLLCFVVDSTDIFADHTEEEQLEATDAEDRRNQGYVTRSRDALHQSGDDEEDHVCE